jgi:hypothetical protein
VAGFPARGAPGRRGIPRPAPPGPPAAPEAWQLSGRPDKSPTPRRAYGRPALSPIVVGLDGRPAGSYAPGAEDEARRKAWNFDWHAEDAAAAEGADDWFAADFHLGRLLRLRPADPALWRRRAEALRHLGQPDLADLHDGCARLLGWVNAFRPSPPPAVGAAIREGSRRASHLSSWHTRRRPVTRRSPAGGSAAADPPPGEGTVRPPRRSPGRGPFGAHPA